MFSPGKIRGPLLGAAAAVLVLCTTALAGSGVGGVFNLGQTNTVNGTSTLTGATAGTQLNVKNTSTSSSASGLTGQSSSTTAAGVLGENLAGGPGLQAYVNTGAPPLKVNSTGLVANLNASLLGGHASSYFLPTTGTAANSNALAGHPSTYFLSTTGTAANSSKLGGHASTYFLPTSGTAADSAKLGGQPARAFYRLRTSADANTLTTVDSGSVLGLYSSATIGSDGLGLISYYDLNNGDLKVAHCTNVACSSATTNRLCCADDAGEYSSITIGTDGLPLISYYDATYGNLEVAHCYDVVCSSADTTTLDGDVGPDVGQYSSITIGSDGLGLISYYDATNHNLKVAHCSNVACSSASIAAANDFINYDWGKYSSVTIGGDGLGLVSFYDATAPGLRTFHCKNVVCSQFDANGAVLGGGGAGVGQYSSVTSGSDGLGLISYFDATNGDLDVAHCSEAAGSNLTTATLDSTGTVGSYSSVTIGPDGLDLISYYDGTNGHLKVAHCVDVVCSSATTTTLDNATFVGAYSSSTIGTDGLPLISYWDGNNDALKVAHCSGAFCTAYFRRR